MKVVLSVLPNAFPLSLQKTQEILEQVGEKMIDVVNNLKKVIDEMKEEELRLGLKEGSVSLCAVSKTKPLEMIEAVLSSPYGVNNIGENYVQEIEAKFADRSSNPIFLSHPFNLRLIGHLQSNKVKAVLPLVDYIDSVDSLKLLDKINEHAIAINKRIKILLELNTAHDGEKTGFATDDELIRALDGVETKQGVEVKGLMTMGALNGSDNKVAASFAHCRKVMETVAKEHPTLCLDTLSMGMSSDYKIAMSEGSTMIRIGTNIFGARGVL